MKEPRRDNWGTLARIGLFIVGNEAVPEAEWWAMAPPNTSVHAARVTAGTPWAHWNEHRSTVTLAADVQHGAEQFAAMRLTAVTVGHSSSSFLGGAGWDQAIINKLADVLDSTVTIGTNGLDCMAALRAARIQRPLLVLPPWFGQNIISAARQYFADHEISLADVLSFDPGPKWRDVPPQDMYPRGIGFEQALEPLYQQIINSSCSHADGVLIAGTGFRCVGIIDQLEQEMNLPVITANQASLWHSLRRTGIDTKIDGYGCLLSQH
jgi:maleate isomerase